MYQSLCTSIAILLLSCGWITAQTNQKQRFPVSATVATGNAQVHCGPAKVHYATDRLAKGTSVDVYRLDPDGWCAIRPPKRSFSIVPVSAINQTDIDLGIVKENKTPAWVGTLLGSVKEPMYQVQLKRNERVEILGVIETPNGNKTQSWFQIKPPSGEYRWIHINQLAASDVHAIKLAAGEIQTPTKQSARPQQYVGNLQQQRTVPTRSIGSRSGISGIAQNRTHQPSIPTRPIGNSSGNSNFANATPVQKHRVQVPLPGSETTTGWRPAKKPASQFVDNTTNYQNDFSSNQVSSIPTRQISSNQKTTVHENLTLVTPVAGQPTSNSTELQSLDVALSNEMLKQANQWNLEQIKQRAINIRNIASNPAHRDHANRILNKIANCEILIRPNRTASTKTNHRTIAKSNTDVIAKNYDAYGTLQELVRDGGLGQTTYVLQDSRGENHASHQRRSRFESASVSGSKSRSHWSARIQPAIESSTRHGSTHYRSRQDPPVKAASAASRIDFGVGSSILP